MLQPLLRESAQNSSLFRALLARQDRPFAEDKAVEHMLESGSAAKDAGKTVCVVERGVKSYG
jgi:hypothetical protein